MPTFSGLNLACADVDATAAFYRLFGFDVPDVARHGGIEHLGGIVVATGADIDIDLDNTALVHVYNAGSRESPSPGGVVMSFHVPDRDSVDQLYATMTGAGYEGRQPPWDAFWGARYAIVADPDGRDVGIMSPSDPDRRGLPPQLP